MLAGCVEIYCTNKNKCFFGAQTTIVNSPRPSVLPSSDKIKLGSKNINYHGYTIGRLNSLVKDIAHFGEELVSLAYTKRLGHAITLANHAGRIVMPA
jgi:hypothetical protein